MERVSWFFVVGLTTVRQCAFGGYYRMGDGRDQDRADGLRSDLGVPVAAGLGHTWSQLGP